MTFLRRRHRQASGSSQRPQGGSPITAARVRATPSAGSTGRMRDKRDDHLDQTPQNLPVDPDGPGPEYDDDNPPGVLDFLKAAKDGMKMLRNLEP